MSMIAKNRIKSTWTPLSNEETNNKVNKDENERCLFMFSANS